MGSHIFLINGKGLAHSIEAVVAAVLRFHDNLACAGIGVVAKLYRVLIITNLQTTLGNLNGICRSNGAAGVGVVTAHCHHGCDGFRLDGKGLAHGVGVIALTGQGNSGCASIKVILVLHCIVRVYGQRSLAIFHCQFRNNGAAGIRLGRDRLYHIGGQSLGGDIELLLDGTGIIALTSNGDGADLGADSVVGAIGSRIVGILLQGCGTVLDGDGGLDLASGVGIGALVQGDHGIGQGFGLHGDDLFGCLGHAALGVADGDLGIGHGQGPFGLHGEFTGIRHNSVGAIIICGLDGHALLFKLFAHRIFGLGGGAVDGNAGQGLVLRLGELGIKGQGLAVSRYALIADSRIRNGGVHAVGKLIAGLGGQRHIGGVSGVGRELSASDSRSPSDAAGVVRAGDGSLRRAALHGLGDSNGQVTGEFGFNYYIDACHGIGKAIKFIIHTRNTR